MSKSRNSQTIKIIAIIIPMVIIFVAIIALAVKAKSINSEEDKLNVNGTELGKDFAFSLSPDKNIRFVSLAGKENLELDQNKRNQQFTQYFLDSDMENTDIPMILGEDNVNGSLLQPSLKTLIAAAKLRNEATVGWLRIRNTNMDFAVLYNPDNVDFYNTRTYDDKAVTYTSASKGYNGYTSKYSCVWGHPMAGFGPTRDDLKFNTVLFGHNWRNIYATPRVDDPKDIMMEQLAAYCLVDYAQEHQYINFSMENDDMTWLVVAAYYTEDYWQDFDKTLDFNYIYADLDNDEQKERYIKEILDRSEYTCDYDLDINDKFLTISTCTRAKGSSDRQRFVVAAVLLDKEEGLPDVVYTKNPSPKKIKV